MDCQKRNADFAARCMAWHHRAMNGLPVRWMIGLGLGLFVTPVAAAIIVGVETITVRDDNGNGAFFTVDFEGNYLPNVVLRENGAASFEALKAQAVCHLSVRQ